MHLIIEDSTAISVSIVFSDVYIYVNRGLLRLLELCFHLILSLFRSVFISIYPFTIQFECYKCACFQCFYR
jgi:hypothetical protein